MIDTELKQSMDYILDNVIKVFPVKEDCLPFIGSILYLKKIGANLFFDNPYSSFLERIEEFDVLLQDNPLSEIIHDILVNVAIYVKSSDLTSLLRLIAIEKISEDAYIYLYDFLINRCNFIKEDRNSFFVPKQITDLAQALIGMEAGKTFVPFGGLMNFATNLSSYEKLHSYERYRQTWLIGMLRLGLAGLLTKVQFTFQDIEFSPYEKYDTIISLPPFGQPMRMESSPSFINAGSIEYSELATPCRFLENTTDKGVCVAFMPTSLLWGESFKKNFRKWTVENNILDTIILLPKNLLKYTGIQIACIVLRRNPIHFEAVRMIDASGFYTNSWNQNLLEVGDIMDSYHKDIDQISRTVPYKEILEHDFSWNVHEYLQKELVCPEGFSISKLEDLVSMSIMERSEESYKSNKGFIIKASDLSDDWSNPYINMEKLSMEYVDRGYMRLEREAILVATTSTKLKPSIIKASKECPVWINRNVLAFSPSDKIDAEYLCMKLSEIDFRTLGTGIHIIKKSLLRIDIIYPELSIQKSLYTEAKHAVILAKAKEIGLQEIISKMKADYMNEVRARKHDMKTPMTQLRNTLTLIKELISELPEEFASKLEKYANRQQKAMDVLSSIVSHIADEDVFATPEIVDVESVLRSFETSTDRYFIEYHCDSASLSEAGIEIPYLMIGKVDFIRLVQNIVSNAIHRGFVKDRTDYALHISLSVDGDFYVIDFSNNGEPLPEGMDKMRYGTKGTKGINSNGSGTGGYIVKSITEHYGGDFDIFSTKFAGIYFTNVIVKLPIYRKEDE